MDQETREAFDRLDARIDRLDAKVETQGATLREEMASLGADLRTKIETTAEETRRHFDVAMEFMRGEFRAMAEGPALSNQLTAQRFGEQTERSDRLEGRVLGLEVRVSRLEEDGRPRRARRRS